MGAYVALCKPRIVELLLITAVPTLFLAYKGLPSLLVTVVVVLGGALAAGSANALNCYIDRDIDEIMRRTSSRPLVRHTVSPRSALVFGLCSAWSRWPCSPPPRTCSRRGSRSPPSSTTW